MQEAPLPKASLGEGGQLRWKQQGLLEDAHLPEGVPSHLAHSPVVSKA